MVKRLPINLDKTFATKALESETFAKVLAENNTAVMHRIYLIANDLKDFQPFMELEHERLTISANITIRFGYAGDAREQAISVKDMKTKVVQRPEYIISFTISEKANMVELFKFKHTTGSKQEVYDLISSLEQKLKTLL